MNFSLYICEYTRKHFLKMVKIRTKRQLSPPLIHQKIIWMLSNECWRRTPGTHSLWKEVGQNIKDKKRDKRFRNRDLSWVGSREGGEVSKQQEILSSAGLWGVLESQRQHNQEGKKKKKNPQNTLLNATPSGEVAQMLTSATSEQGERWVACLG